MADWTQKLKLHHLQMLVALGEQGNLTQVAKMMNITQPALSKWLSQFEDEVGMVLFERHSKGLRPTEGGKLLLQHAQRLINDMSRSQYEIERFKQGGQVGSLMIGCSPGGDRLRLTGNSRTAERDADPAPEYRRKGHDAAA